MEKYYKILDVHINATEQEVKQAYQDMIKVWHPDRFPNDIKLQKKANEKTKQINEAYEQIINHLKNPHKQQQSQQHERTDKQEKQAGQPPPSYTKPKKTRRYYMKYWGLFLVIGSILLVKIMGSFIHELIHNTGIRTATTKSETKRTPRDLLKEYGIDYKKPISSDNTETTAPRDLLKEYGITPRTATTKSETKRTVNGTAKSNKLNLHDYTGAIQDYSKAIKLNPKDVMAYFNRGEAKFNLEDYSGAIQDYNKALELNSYSAWGYWLRGLAKEKAKFTWGALEDLRKAEKLGYAEAYEDIQRIQKGN